MSLSLESIEDLNWWIVSLPSAYRSIDHGVPDVILTSDASLRFGCCFGTARSYGLWSEAETTYHINVLELLAVELGLHYNELYQWYGGYLASNFSADVLSRHFKADTE